MKTFLAALVSTALMASPVFAQPAPTPTAQRGENLRREIRVPPAPPANQNQPVITVNASSFEKPTTQWPSTYATFTGNVKNYNPNKQKLVLVGCSTLGPCNQVVMNALPKISQGGKFSMSVSVGSLMNFDIKRGFSVEVREHGSNGTTLARAPVQLPGVPNVTPPHLHDVSYDSGRREIIAETRRLNPLRYAVLVQQDVAWPSPGPVSSEYRYFDPSSHRTRPNNARLFGFSPSRMGYDPTDPRQVRKWRVVIVDLRSWRIIRSSPMPQLSP